MEDYWEDEETEDEDFPAEPFEEDEEILRRYSKLKIIRQILAIVAILCFLGVFVALELAQHLPGPQTPDYFSLVDDFSDFARFDPGVVRYSIAYKTQYNHELLESTIRTAASEWEDELDGYLNFTWAEDGEVADLIIAIVDDLPHPGRAYLEFVGEQYRPRVELNATRLSDPAILHIVIAHELGHALGIWGHSDHPGDLMYPAPVRVVPSKRDARTLKLIYGID